MWILLILWTPSFTNSTLEPTNYQTIPSIVPTLEPTTNPSLEPTVEPTTEPTNGYGTSFHFIAAGAYDTTIWDSYSSDDYSLCTDDATDQSAIESPLFSYNITASCCEEDGSGGARPDCTAYPVTYDEAVQICAENGYRLCTLQELLWDQITRDRATGCSFDGSYNWVSDSCTMAPTSNPTQPTSDPTLLPTASPTRNISIECEETVNGSIGDYPDTVYITFINTQIQSVTFTDCDSNFDPKLYLIDSSGDYIQDQSDNNCGGDDCIDWEYCDTEWRETFTMENLAEGMYTLMLRPYNFGGDWSVSIYCRQPSRTCARTTYSMSIHSPIVLNHTLLPHRNHLQYDQQLMVC